MSEVITYCGRDIETLTRAELIEALRCATEILRELRENQSKLSALEAAVEARVKFRKGSE